MHPLRVEQLTKTYGEETAVDDLSFEVQPGRVTGFLGPNGAGKSTTMKILVDLAEADSGRATIGGRRYRDLDDPLGTVGVLLEQDDFHPARTGRNHLRVMADAAGVDDDRVVEALAIVGLGEAADRRVGGYSKGLKQRLGLATALLTDPAVLLLDEPGNGLDPRGLRWLRQLLRWRADQGNTVLVSSHLLAEMQQLADEVVVINRGRLIAVQAMAELLVGGVRVATPGAQRLRVILETSGATVETPRQDVLLVHGLDAPDIGHLALEAGIVLHELAPAAASLEELFLTLTGAGGPGGTGPAPPTPEQGA